MKIADYEVIKYNKYDYSQLEEKWIRRSHAGKPTYSYEKIITLDTETSFVPYTDIGYITDWSITIEDNVCIYGNHIKDLITTIEKIANAVNADETHLVKIFVHNFSYDYNFMRNHMFQKWGTPSEKDSLAAKSRKYIFMRFSELGVEFRDSAILTQRTLERLCKDMGTTQKATGKWDYSKFRTPDSGRTIDEIIYACTDTIALEKAIRKYIEQRGCNTATVPLTNTGFIRNKARSLSRKDKKWRRKFLDMQLSLDQYKLLTDCYHGGYTHANRYYVNRIITEKMQCYDFASSYPAVMCYEKYPMSAFTEIQNISVNDILELKDDFAFAGYLEIGNLRCKKDSPMPPLAFWKSKYIIFPDESLTKKQKQEAYVDNGKILQADFVVYPFTDPDLQAIVENYDFDFIKCSHVMRARKDYLPEWLTNYIMELYYNKSTKKHADQVLYMISKGELNGVYGMMVQKMIQDLCEEDYSSSQWIKKVYDGEEAQDKLNKFYSSRNSFLSYQWGVWITAYAQANLFELGKCCDHWIYSDTDSVKGYGWNKDKLDIYNNNIIKKSNDRNIGLVEYNGEQFRLGIADFDGEYTEFITQGAKKYCYRENGELHITLAGVPKDGVYCLDDDITNFCTGFVFRNNETYRKNYKKVNPDKEIKWKLRTEYLYSDGIKTIEINGSTIEYGCAVRLSETEYRLDHCIAYDIETGLPLEVEFDAPLYE